MSPIPILVLLMAFGVASMSAQDRVKLIDVQRSTITIHVGKAGLFSVAGHEHWVSAPISAGLINNSAAPHVEFRVDASKLEVKPDPKVDAKTQAEIQKDMQELTLESAKYPEIVFSSSRVEKQGEDQWKVYGTLTLHGVAKPVAVTVRRDGAMYVSHATVKQSDFGIKPVTVAGGLIKVKDEVEIDFRIATRPE
ncbi:MAG TPA: YceI family protein [Bryobacteraceae bacterium]|nr:YceI family protein [Bryobacteraceae bacterium]